MNEPGLQLAGDDYQKPLPRPSEQSRAFWQACREDHFILQRCSRCHSFWFPPSPLCPECLSEDWAWEQASGRGSIFSYVVMHRVYHPGFASDVPYLLAVVELEEGPRFLSNIVGCENKDPRVGLPVEVVFDAVTSEVTLPKWRLAPSTD